MMHRIRPVLIVVVIAGIAAAAWFALRDRHPGGLEASGTVEATDAQLGFEVSGRIIAVLAREGDVVAAGQPLAHLDTLEVVARREQARAQVAAARALLLQLERGSRPEEIEQARAAADAADHRLTDAQRDLDRAQQLIATGAIAKETFDKVQLAFGVAQAQQIQATQQKRLVDEGPRTEQIQAQRGVLAQAEAAVRTLDATIANMTLRAPFAGVVTVRSREPGEVVAPGAGVLTVLNRDDRWVRIYVPERHVGQVKLGGPATIHSDSYPDKAYRGEVIYVSSEAEFTPKTVQTREERVKLVYAVKVRITDDPDDQLKPGMPADVRLEGLAP